MQKLRRKKKCCNEYYIVFFGILFLFSLSVLQLVLIFWRQLDSRYLATIVNTILALVIIPVKDFSIALMLARLYYYQGTMQDRKVPGGNASEVENMPELINQSYDEVDHHK